MQLFEVYKGSDRYYYEVPDYSVDEFVQIAKSNNFNAYPIVAANVYKDGVRQSKKPNKVAPSYYPYFKQQLEEQGYSVDLEPGHHADEEVPVNWGDTLIGKTLIQAEDRRNREADLVRGFDKKLSGLVESGINNISSDRTLPMPAQQPPQYMSMALGQSQLQMPARTKSEKVKERIAEKQKRKKRYDFVNDLNLAGPEVLKSPARGVQRTLGAFGGSALEASGDMLENVRRNLSEYQYQIGNKLFPNKEAPPPAENSIQTAPMSMEQGLAEEGRQNYEFWNKAADTGIESRDKGISFENTPIAYVVGSAGESLPTMIGAVALSAAGMPNFGTALLTTSEILPEYTEMRKKGLSGKEAFGNAFIMGTGTYALEKAGLEAVTFKNPAINKVINKLGKKWYTGALVNFAAEGSQEALQEIYQNAVKMGYDEDVKLLDNALQAGLAGGLLGGGASTAIGIRDGYLDYVSKKADKIDDGTNVIKNKPKSEKTISEEELANLSNDFENEKSELITFLEKQNSGEEAINKVRESASPDSLEKVKNEIFQFRLLKDVQGPPDQTQTDQTAIEDAGAAPVQAKTDVDSARQAIDDSVVEESPRAEQISPQSEQAQSGVDTFRQAEEATPSKHIVKETVFRADVPQIGQRQLTGIQDIGNLTGINERPQNSPFEFFTTDQTDASRYAKRDELIVAKYERQSPGEGKRIFTTLHGHKPRKSSDSVIRSQTVISDRALDITDMGTTTDQFKLVEMVNRVLGHPPLPEGWKWEDVPIDVNETMSRYGLYEIGGISEDQETLPVWAIMRNAQTMTEAELVKRGLKDITSDQINGTLFAQFLIDNGIDTVVHLHETPNGPVKHVVKVHPEWMTHRYEAVPRENGNGYHYVISSSKLTMTKDSRQTVNQYYQQLTDAAEELRQHALNVANGIIRNKSNSEDLAQDVMARFYQKVEDGSFDPSKIEGNASVVDKAKNYISRAAMNAAINKATRGPQNKEVSLNEPVGESGTEKIDNLADVNAGVSVEDDLDIQKAFNDAGKKLKFTETQMSDALAVAGIEGTVEERSIKTGVSQSTIRNRSKRVLEKIREEIENSGYTFEDYMASFNRKNMPESTLSISDEVDKDFSEIEKNINEYKKGGFINVGTKQKQTGGSKQAAKAIKLGRPQANIITKISDSFAETVLKFKEAFADPRAKLKGKFPQLKDNMRTELNPMRRRMKERIEGWRYKTLIDVYNKEGETGLYHANDIALTRDLVSRGSEGQDLPDGVEVDEYQKHLDWLESSASPEVLRVADLMGKYLRMQGEGLVARQKLDAEDLRKDYFPHKVMDYQPTWLKGVYSAMKSRFGAPYRSYTRKAVGSKKIIRSDLDTVWAHMLAVELDNAQEDWMLKEAGTYDKLKEWRKNGGKNLRKGQKVTIDGQDYKAVEWKKTAFEATAINEGLFEQALEKDLSAREFAESRGPQGAKPLKPIIAKGKSKIFLLPVEVAESLDNMVEKSPGVFDLFYSFGRLTQLWKGVTLVTAGAPYQVGNAVGDTINTSNFDPASFAYLRSAEKIARQLYMKEKTQLNDFQKKIKDIALQKDVIGSGFSAELRGVYSLNKISDLWFKSNEYRESILRLSILAHQVSRVDSGKPVQKVAGIKTDGLDGYSAAAKIARESLVDYGATPRMYQLFLSRGLTPFIRFHEANARNHLRAAFGSGSSAIKYWTPILAAYSAAYAWNNSDERKEIEMSIPDYIRNRWHLNLGKNKDGTLRVLAPQQPVDMAWSWLGIDNVSRILSNIHNKKYGFREGVEDFRKSALGGVGSNIQSLMNPMVQYFQGLYSNVDPFTKRKIMPDATFKEFRNNGMFNGLWEKRTRGYMLDYLIEKVITPAMPYTRSKRSTDPSTNPVWDYLKEGPLNLKRAVGYFDDLDPLSSKKQDFYSTKDSAVATREYYKQEFENILFEHGFNKELINDLVSDAVDDGLTIKEFTEDIYGKRSKKGKVSGGWINSAKGKKLLLLHELKNTKSESRRIAIRKQITALDRLQMQEIGESVPKSARGIANDF